MDAAGDVYHRDLMMGRRQSGLSGHWRDELAALESGLAKLRQKRTAIRGKTDGPGLDELLRATLRRDDLPAIEHDAVRELASGKRLRITATVRSPGGVKWVRLRYRAVNQTLDYATLDMKQPTDGDRYAATVPADEIDPTYDFMYLIEAMDKDGNGKIYPDFEKETPYIVVKLRRDDTKEPPEQ